ncbi:hypothetical protein PG991_012631 [Apiospora marii]|uniref:Uncharacterized protein n=1 Tax=Apiospora marii TaxID=335849 RepID=A0ABR1RA99_9PEZI
MIIGIVFTALYLGQNYAIISWVGSKEEDNETQVPADVTALNESHRYDVDQKRDDFVISENPADSTMCPDELHGCQSFDIRSGLLPEDTAEAAATPNATTYKIGEIALSSSTSSSSSRATLHPISCTTKPQAAHISTFVAVFIMIRRLFLG